MAREETRCSTSLPKLELFILGPDAWMFKYGLGKMDVWTVHDSGTAADWLQALRQLFLEHSFVFGGNDRFPALQLA